MILSRRPPHPDGEKPLSGGETGLGAAPQRTHCEAMYKCALASLMAFGHAPLRGVVFATLTD